MRYCRNCNSIDLLCRDRSGSRHLVQCKPGLSCACRARFECLQPTGLHGLQFFLTGIFSNTFSRYFQYFRVEEILARSSGECAPRMVGPKEIMSISG